MKPYVVEIELPSGRVVRKGLLAVDENYAAEAARFLQTQTNKDNIPRFPRGEIIEVYERPPNKPVPRSVLSSPDAVKILSHFRLGW